MHFSVQVAFFWSIAHPSAQRAEKLKQDRIWSQNHLNAGMAQGRRSIRPRQRPTAMTYPLSTEYLPGPATENAISAPKIVTFLKK